MAGRLKEFYNNSGFLNAVRYKITPFMIKRKKDLLLFDDSEFYRLNLNCRGDAFYRYVNIEDKRTKGRVFVSPMDRLPFSDNTVKFIIVDFETLKDKRNKWLDFFKDWSRVLVSNGVLVLDNIWLDEELSSLFKKAGFIPVSPHRDANLPVANFVNNKIEDFYKKDIFYYQEEKGRIILSSEGNPEASKLDIEVLDGLNIRFDRMRIKGAFEHLYPAEILSFLKKIDRIMAEDARLELDIENEITFKEGRPVSFFDKANLSLIFSEMGFRMERIENTEGSIKAVIRKKTPKPVSVQGIRKKRVCFVDQFLMFRHNHLGFDNDAIARTCDELGLDALLVEGMRNIEYKALKSAILSHRPEYLIFRLKEVLPFIFYIKDDLKRMGTKTAFWYCDPGHPEKKDLGGLVDTMFLSNRGQVDEYRNAYNIKRVYYMPQAHDHYALHRIDLPEIYDVGFAGALSSVPLHKSRNELMRVLREKYNVNTKNNVRNNIAEFYSQSRTVFGASDFDYELYTSNRFFIALGCGACYVTKKFKGIELLAENRKHLLWFDEKEELFDILDYYLSHKKEREDIRNAAERLSLEKHTYADRMRNILDILDGKTESFYGFI